MYTTVQLYKFSSSGTILTNSVPPYFRRYEAPNLHAPIELRVFLRRTDGCRANIFWRQQPKDRVISLLTVEIHSIEEQKFIVDTCEFYIYVNDVDSSMASKVVDNQATVKYLSIEKALL
jgi:hypothetical protein